MNSRLAINEHAELVESAGSENPQTPAALRTAAHILSYLFHPVFVPLYVIYFVTFLQPYLVPGFTIQAKVIMLVQAFLMYTFFPLVTVLLLKALHFINSIKLTTQKDRIIPFIACNIWYFWIWYVWRNLPEYPVELVVFAFSVFMASSLGLMANIYLKVSMHAIALGTACAFLCWLGCTAPVHFGIYLSVAFLITGMVLTSRLLLGAHNGKELYSGLAVGVLGLLIAIIIY